jgi:group I intron endonuclease
MYGSIYKVTNLHNHKVYIGLTKDYNKRHSAHIKDCFNPESTRYHFTLYKAIRKYGLHNFHWEILGSCENRKELNQAEIICIEHFQSNNKIYGYNNTSGGDGGPIRLGAKLTKETKNKMSLSAANRIISDEQRRKTSNTLKGKKLSEDTKEKMLKKKLNVPHPIHKKVINLTTRQIFNTPREAAEHDNRSYNSIIEICNGRQKQTQGYIYKYIGKKDHLN